MPGYDSQLPVGEREDELALEDVEGIVLVLMDVALEHPAGDDLDDREVEARRIAGPGEELDVAEYVPLSGRDDDRAGIHPPILCRTPSHRSPAAGRLDTRPER